MYDIWTQRNAEKVKDLISKLTYKEGWDFSIFSHFSNTGWLFELRVRLDVKESSSVVGSKTTVRILVNHPFPIPEYPMDDKEAERWLLDCILMVEQHETCEHFRIGGEAIFYPEHGEGANSYRITRKE